MKSLIFTTENNKQVEIGFSEQSNKSIYVKSSSQIFQKHFILITSDVLRSNYINDIPIEWKDDEISLNISQDILIVIFQKLQKLGYLFDISF